MTSVNGIPCFELKLDNVAQCVVPGNNRDELEIHFPENDGEKEEEGLVQITLHFPAGDEDDEETPAQEFQKDIMSTGVIRSITGDIIAEFTKDQGNFVTPRGKYSIQMLSTYMHMQGAQYSYKIKYTDISKCYLLDKPDGLRMLFVIVLDKPIRQGSQKYQSLVIETNKIETTMKINLTEAEITKDYEGSDLKPELSAPLCNLYGKLFKILAQQTIFIPKAFSSFRDEKSIRCTYKTSEGLLFPLTKSIIFVHKPTIIVNFDDIDLVDFKRADQAGNAGARTFDIEFTLKKNDVVGESKYLFVSVDRAEAQPLAQYLESKNVQVINPQNNDRKAKGMFVGMDGGDDDEEEDEEDDGDYKAGQSSGSENDSDDSGGSDEEEEGEKEAKPAKKRVAKAETSPREKGPKREKKEKAPAGKKTKKPKDKDAPKRGMSAYMLFANSQRNVVKAEMPGLSMTDMSKELGVRWKALGPEDKEVRHTLFCLFVLTEQLPHTDPNFLSNLPHLPNRSTSLWPRTTRSATRKRWPNTRPRRAPTWT
jgi:structure-specific recognition protein 1